MIDVLLAPPPRLTDLQPQEALLITGTRRWVMARRTGCCPLQAAAAPLGSVDAAGALHLLLATLGASWPDPFAVAPPCCATLTYDEATLVGMVLSSRRHTRPVFDALLCEMLDQDARDRLFSASRALALAIGLR